MKTSPTSLHKQTGAYLLEASAVVEGNRIVGNRSIICTSDVILTQNFKGESAVITRRSVSETVVENLRVLAIDAIETKPQAGNNSGFGRTVTLEVTPDQAELINVSTELGKLCDVWRFL